MVEASGAITAAHKTARHEGEIQPAVRAAVTIYDRAENHPPLPFNLTMALLPDTRGVFLLILKAAGELSGRVQNAAWEARLSQTFLTQVPKSPTPQHVTRAGGATCA